MGLLLSILVACVGVVELLDFCFNVRRNFVSITNADHDIPNIRRKYLQEFKKRDSPPTKNCNQNIKQPSQNGTYDRNLVKTDLESYSNGTKDVPVIRLNKNTNNEEDIELEFSDNVIQSRSRSSSPRRFLLTEKESQYQPASPRKFLVSEEPQDVKRSKSPSPLPEYIVTEDRSRENSPTRLFRVKDQETNSKVFPLPHSFVVTEEETEPNERKCDIKNFATSPRNEDCCEDYSNETNYFTEETSSSECLQNNCDDLHIRSSSPFPTYEMLAPRNSVCSELLNASNINMEEVDEEMYRSKSPTPEKVDMILEKKDIDTTMFRTNKLLVTEPHLKFNWCSQNVQERYQSPEVCYVNSDVCKDPALKELAPGGSSIVELEVNDPPLVTVKTNGDIHETTLGQNSKCENKLNEVDIRANEISEKCRETDKGKPSNLNSPSDIVAKDVIVVKNEDFEDVQASTSFHNDEETSKDNNAKATSVFSNLPESVNSHQSESNKLNSAKSTPGGEPFWLIFSGEYTKAMNKDWHGQHFCCWQCDESLTGQRYVLRDDHPYCVSCYESVFANACEKCSRTIGIDSKDLSYKDKHWHEACFLCTSCGQSLVDKQFGSKGDRIYCGRCYDEQFASRCDGCHEIFRAGTKKMEYKTRQWHEKCFCCCVCKVPIGTQSFIPREQEIYCAKCYEEKFATRCIKCNKVITSGGVTYKNEPWHRECFVCTHCSKSLAGERFTSRDEKPYCAECFGELFAKRCFACNKPITGIGGTKFISFEDRHWHNDCFFCAHCRTSLVGRGFITDEQDIICPECAKQKLL